MDSSPKASSNLRLTRRSAAATLAFGFGTVVRLFSGPGSTCALRGVLVGPCLRVLFRFMLAPCVRVGWVTFLAFMVSLVVRALYPFGLVGSAFHHLR